MKKFLVSKRGMLAAAGAAVLLLAPIVGSEVVRGKADTVKNLTQGSSTCFTRVGQTFTALMIKDFSSPYLAKDFTATTGECFSQLNKTFDAAFGAAFLEAKKPLNKLTSDLFWFQEKVLKTAEMAKNSEMEISSNSTVMSKFSSLEELSLNFQEKIESKAQALETWRAVLAGVGLLGAFAVAAFALFAGWSRQKEKGVFERYNLEARDLLEASGDKDKLILKTGRLMEALFQTAQAPACRELYERVIGDLIEGAAAGHSDNKVYEEKTEAATKVQEQGTVKGETTNFGEAARTLVDRISDKAFTHGILLAQELDEDFLVKGNEESLGQLLHNLLSFAVENSLSQNEGRKITVRAKALGGIAYFKTRISNYLLNPDEIEFFNGGGPKANSNVNLLLMKEIAADMGVSIAAKNIVNGGANFTGAEIEVVFKRAKDETASNEKSSSKRGLSKVVKGGKKDILKALGAEA